MARTRRSERLVRAARSRAWKSARRLGLVPSGQADHLGEDATLVGATLPHRVMVFFPDPPGSLYQLEQWFPTLREVDAELGVVVVLQDSRTARAVRARSGLDVIVVARPSTLDDLLSRSALQLCLYVNHNPANFTNLRFTDLVHVSLMHGDSDKSVSVSNQLKAYDYAFVAGQAAVDRVSNQVLDYSAAQRCFPVGRPQIDAQLVRVAQRRVARTSGGPPTVLYAPTWEGPQQTAAYGSVATHGRRLVASLLADGRFRVIYRPHPLTGVGSPEYAAADADVRGLLGATAGPHRVDDRSVSIEDSFAEADVLVCDVSGVAVDWLATGRPLAITVPDGPAVWEGESPLRDAVPSVAAADADRVPDLVAEMLSSDTSKSARLGLIEYYLGDVTPGAAGKQFLAACQQVIVDRAAARAVRDGRHHREVADATAQTEKGS